MLHRMKQVVGMLVSMVLMVGFIPMNALAASVPACSLCILEVGAQGLAGQEDQDYVIVANVTGSNITSTSIQLRYFNSAGIQDSVLGIGTFTAGQVKVYASDALRDINPAATKLTLPLYSQGGRLQIARSTTSTTTIYDQVAWGNATGGEGSFAQPISAGAGLGRKSLDGIPQDTNSNESDWELTQSTCANVAISEIQPFVTDSVGRTTDAWVELRGLSDTVGECRLVTEAGDTYIIAEADMPPPGNLAVISSALDTHGLSVPLHLGEGTVHIWLASSSVYGGGSAVHLPLTDQQFSGLTKGHSWAVFADGWRAAIPSPAVENIELPSNVPVIPETPGPETPDEPMSSVSPDQPLLITELLPNPAAPLTDADDEFIELFNPNSINVSLSGYKLQTGNSYSYSFTFTGQVVPGEGYLVIKSAESNLTLSNSGGKARLLDPTGAVMAETDPYEDAPEGQSWVFNEGAWKWSGTPTAGEENKVTIPILASALKTTTSSTKKSAAPKVTKTAAPKAPAVKAAKTTKAKEERPKAASTQTGKPITPPVHPLVLAGVGGLAIAYAGYEYRQDLRNKLLQLRANRAARRINRK